MSKGALLPIGTEFVDTYRDLVDADDERRSQRPVLHNTDGELLIPCKDTWTLANGARDAALGALEKLGLERDDPQGDGPWAT